jgi:hypothetical protein
LSQLVRDLGRKYSFKTPVNTGILERGKKLHKNSV